jgi:acyl-CoA reductase-like NAD-dependent aldehyde dehydrogenase
MLHFGASTTAAHILHHRAWTRARARVCVCVCVCVFGVRLQGKFANAGQTCIAPDYVLVHSAVKERFIECMKATIVAQFGADASASENYGRVINDMHWKRVTGYLEKGCTVLYGGESDAKTRYVAPTLVDISSDDLAAKAPIMMEEIFGPLLPIVTVSDMDEAIAFGARAVASLSRGVLAEIYLCAACSCHEIMRRNGPDQ